MTDVVVTVPKCQWASWIAEGGLPDDPWGGSLEYGFRVSSVPAIQPGERVYIVAHGRLRGYAALIRIARDETFGGALCPVALVRHGNGQAVTIPETVPGFRGYRYRWWRRADERRFDDWMTP